MEIDSKVIKKLRIQRNWTQQHLADACDISLRTVQRIEKLGNASNESVMSLCAVFEIAKTDICVVPKKSNARLQSASFREHYLIMFSGLMIGLLLGASIMYWWVTG
ncbi:helix-turn-helix transcriptional regulator [uncultured Paraglaciecola sp.]|uniref:helix-turn-helix transcriptional regulator n=1 Tax=uncultured Paraglaciecola sp. TaxID=1765024 RepID=UPI0030DCDC72|tara:strand:+ start:115584 stop:115901 length:318 start_codon:yes stop_codon:yes gene_type:complete